MTPPILPPEIARELADLRRQLLDLQRRSGRDAPPIGGLSDVDGVAWEDGVVLRYFRTSGRWVTRQAARVLEAGASSTLGLTTSWVDVPGATITFGTFSVNAQIAVNIICDFEHAASGGGAALGRAVLDGTAIGPQSAILLEAANRATVGQGYTAAIATPGNHTLKLQASKSSAGGTVNAISVHTGFTAILID